MKLKPQVTWLPLFLYAYTAIQTLVGYASTLKNSENTDNLLICGTLIAVLWIEKDSIISILKDNNIINKYTFYGLILFLLSYLIIFIGREITSLIIELWGLFLLAASMITLFSSAKYIRSAIFIAISGSVIVLLGRLAPAFMSSEMAIAIARLAAIILNYFIPPVVSSGVSIYFGQYAVEVVSACSGMNSMFSLLALSVLYIRQEGERKLWHILLLVALVIPVAMITNLLA
jgi:exosortase/archaeosortase